MPIRDVVNTGCNVSALGSGYRLKDMAADHLHELQAELNPSNGEFVASGYGRISAGYVDDITVTAGVLPLLPDGAAEAAAEWVATHPVFDVDALAFEGSTPQLINAIRDATSPTSDLDVDAKIVILTLESAAQQYEAEAAIAAQKEAEEHFAASESDDESLRGMPSRHAWLKEQQRLRAIREVWGEAAKELMQAADSCRQLAKAAYTKAAAAKDAPAKAAPPSVAVDTTAPPQQTPTPELHLPPTAVTAGDGARCNRWSKRNAPPTSSSSSIPQALKPSSSSGKL